MNAEVTTVPGTLTYSESRFTPGTATLISETMIQESGARNLVEILEAHVPGFQVLRHHFVGYNIGSRGLLVDQNNKVLLRVNGKVMNHLTFYGADSELMLPLLGDIKTIEVIRGPGSATYGPGAIAMVINITTHSASEFTGQEVKLRQGFIEDFTTLELKLGHQFTDGQQLFFYGGLADYRGSDFADAPHFYSVDIPGSTKAYNFTDDRQASRDKPHLKLHLQYQWENFQIWSRYTQAGEKFRGYRRFLEEWQIEEPVDLGYRHFTTEAQWLERISADLRMTFSLGYDLYDRYRAIPFPTSPDPVDLNLREEEIAAKLLFNWKPGAQHQLAFGAEYAFGFFGRDTFFGYPDSAATPLPDNSSWTSHFGGLFIEDQWTINDQFRLFSGLRLDKHQYTDFMWSPNLTAVYSPNKDHTIKLSAGRSVRRTSDFFLRLERVLNGGQSDEVETLESLELRYDWQITPNWSTGLSIFLNQLDIIAYNTDAQANRPLGELKTTGLEWELNYETATFQARFSHSWTKMLDFHLNDPKPASQVISASPYGYGDHLAHWSDHITKLHLNWQLNQQWKTYLTLIHYWGWPGAEDYANYNYENFTPPWDYTTVSSGDKKAFNASTFLHSGAHYQATEKLRLSLHAYNILGWLDKDFNKRNYFFQMGSYTQEAAAVMFELNYTF